MTTAPTPCEAERLAMTLRSACALSHPRFGTDARFVEMLASQAQAVEKELLRLQAENERLQQLLQCDTPRYCSSVQRCTAGDEHRAKLEARKPLPPAGVDKLMAAAGYLGASAESRADFINGIRHGEAAHGIAGGSS